MNSQSQDSQFNQEDPNSNSNMESESDSKEEEPKQEGTGGPGRKPYERHTRQQKRKLEEYFAKDQHPEEKERNKISKEVGLSPIRVKFWFQNKRTQTKNKSIRTISNQLENEVERLTKENEMLKDGLRSAACTKCGGPVPLGDSTVDVRAENAELRAKLAQVSTENAQLRAEVTRLRLNGKYGGDPWMSSSSSSAPQPSPAEAGPSNFGIPSFVAQPAPSNFRIPGLVAKPQPDQMGSNIFAAEGSSTMANDHMAAAAAVAAIAAGTDNGDLLVRIAEAAVAELQVMAVAGEPLWVNAGSNNAIEFMNEEVYTNSFFKWTVPNSLGWKKEATRSSIVINMDAHRLIEILCNAKKWSAMFTGVVLRATTVEVHSPGKNYDGALQTISAEYQLPSPIVPTRETIFLRYCKELPANQSWVVVDFTLDALHGTPSNRLLKRPSGCVISKMDDMLLKISWVENVEADNSFVNIMCKPIVESGAAFGARRWLAVLDRQSHRIRNVINYNGNPGCSRAQRENQTTTQLNILKLAERLVLTFYAGVACSAGYDWVYEFGTGVNDLQIASKRNAEDPRMPLGIILCATISFWMAAPPKRIFDFLCDESNRDKWDPLSENGILEEETKIPTSNDPGNNISLYKLHGMPSIMGDKKMTFLQETCFDETCSYLAYAPVDTKAMNMCLYGGDPRKVQIVPSGFTIVPDGPTWMARGSMVTTSYQIFVDPNPMSNLNPAAVELVKGLVTTVVTKIRNAVPDENH